MHRIKGIIAWVLTVAVLVTASPMSAFAATPGSLATPQVGAPKVPAPAAPPQTPEEPDKSAPPKDGEGDVTIMWFDVAMDIAGLAMSIADYRTNPTFWNALGVVFDGAAVIIPGLPAVGAIRGGARAAMQYIRRSSKLQTALQAGGVQKYWKLLLRRMPTGWIRHHIIESRFASRLGTTSLKMPAIPIDSAAHQLITNKMRTKIPYGSDYSKMQVRDILQKHADAYQELFDESSDVYWEYLRDYVLEVKNRVPSHIQ